MVVNYNSGDRLEPLLDVLEPEVRQVIVVDNASKDGSQKPAQGRQNTLLIQNEKNRGFAAAVNQGATLCTEQDDWIVLVNDDSYTEGAETLQLVLSNPGVGVLGQQSTATLQITDDSPESSGNPLDDPSFFIRGHYHDFLNREPDQSGLDFWTGNITSCGSDDDCRNVFDGELRCSRRAC